MAKILIRKPKYVEVEGVTRRIGKFRKYYVADISKDFHCNEGCITKEQLQETGTVESSNGITFHIFEATFIDHYKQIKRHAQIIPLKDIGTIITTTGVGKESIVVDAGAGSGGLSLFLAQHVKKIYTHDINDKHIKTVKENIKMLNIGNVELKKHDIYKGILQEEVDLITLDVPEPWKVYKHAKKALKRGGFIVSYSPSIPQTMDFVNKRPEEFLHEKTIEIIERPWDIRKRKVRPKTTGIGHSGFLSFMRRL